MQAHICLSHSQGPALIRLSTHSRNETIRRKFRRSLLIFAFTSSTINSCKKTGHAAEQAKHPLPKQVLLGARCIPAFTDAVHSAVLVKRTSPLFCTIKQNAKASGGTFEHPGRNVQPTCHSKILAKPSRSLQLAGSDNAASSLTSLAGTNGEDKSLQPGIGGTARAATAIQQRKIDQTQSRTDSNDSNRGA